MDLVPLGIIRAKGHTNIKAKHRTTFEITKDDYLTEKGDCIIGISSSAAVGDLSKEAKEYIKSGKRLVILLISGFDIEIIHCQGDEKLDLNNPRKIIVRKSSYIDGATLCIKADKSAADINRNLIKSLSTGNELLVLIIGFIDR
ncbi:MAG: DUF371 domain-containing protein [Fervidicoccaceae archaeon]|jgi:hypothetical protein|nr:MAG: DUF371 domain-containing protein [Fervidicoccus sp.]